MKNLAFLETNGNRMGFIWKRWDESSSYLEHPPSTIILAPNRKPLPRYEREGLDDSDSVTRRAEICQAGLP
jgi:hypothetical protein